MSVNSSNIPRARNYLGYALTYLGRNKMAIEHAHGDTTVTTPDVEKAIKHINTALGDMHRDMTGYWSAKEFEDD
jgi:hypothetical protein